MHELKIAYGNSRQAKFWSNKTITFKDLCERLKTPVRTSETAAEYKKLPKPERDAIKDKGGFVAGHLKDNRQKVDKVACRSAVVYDLDDVTPDFVSHIAERIRYKGVVYSTHSHTPENPRVRAILPVARDMMPDEHNAVARYMAQELGVLEMTDPCSFEPHQLMYWPSVPADGEYLCVELEGELIDPDAVLAQHPEWRDCSLLPTAPKESTAKKAPAGKQKNPLTKPGAVGLFCRTFTIEDTIARFLSDVYESCGSGRYTYIAGESTAGLVVYDNNTFAYSHHATDPAFGKLLNAFDLVRIHNFPDEDPNVSFREMADFAMGLPEVKRLALDERAAEAKAAFEADEAEDWRDLLEYDSRPKKLKNSLRNIRLIMENDPALRGIVFNQLADNMEIKGDVPWSHPAKFWRDADDAQLVSYVDACYGDFSQRNYQIAVTKVADDRSYHPIREYFERLPEWDGVKRIESYFIDYLGAEDNDYVRQVSRKFFCAGYKRVHHPGIKFDFCIVLNGPQGIGKSTAVSKIGMEWYSDSLSLSDMNDKTAAEKLQGFWIIEIGELAGMRKADVDKVKAFTSRQDDKYRASFGRRVTPHPRQCVFIGTTNAENGYLRDITGNRRFWNIKVTGECAHHPWEITQDVIDQLWAEAKFCAEDEELYLPPDVEDMARHEQNQAMETDDRAGLVAEYLDTLLPSNWDELDFYDRQNYFRDPDNPLRAKGVKTRETVSNMEIWCECFGRQKADLKPADSYAIAAIMMQFEDWEKSTERPVLKPYGRQRVYRRKHGTVGLSVLLSRKLTKQKTR